MDFVQYLGLYLSLWFSWANIEAVFGLLSFSWSLPRLKSSVCRPNFSPNWTKYNPSIYDNPSLFPNLLMKLVPKFSRTSLRVFIDIWANPSFFARWAANSVSYWANISFEERAAIY